MVIPVQQFNPETFAQANPFLTGFQAGNQAIQSAIQTRYAQPMLQAQLALEQAKTPNLQAQTQDILQGKMPLEQAQAVAQRALPGLYAAEAANDYSNVPLHQAQAALAQAQIPYVPLNAQARYMQGMGRLLPYSQVGMVARMMNNPTFQAMVANNPQNAQKYTNVMQSVLNGNGVAGLPFNMSVAQQPVSASDINAVQQAAGSDYLKKTTPQNILSQRYYEQSVDNLINNVNPQMPLITQFAGIAGRSKMNADKFAASMNMQTSPAYEAFNNFTHVQAPLIANEIRRAYGGQATDSERQVMDSLANPTYWANNPTLALSQWNSLIGSLRTNAAALSQNPAQNLQSNLATAQGISQPTTLLPNQQNSPLSGGRVSVIAPNGSRGSISAANLSAALASGYRVAQ